MQQCAPDVEIVAAAAMQDEIGRDVDGEAEGGDQQHWSAQHLDGVAQAGDRLGDDPDGDHEQRRAIDQGGQHLEAGMAVGAGRCCRASADPEGVPGETQRRRIGEHVAGIGQESQRAGRTPPTTSATMKPTVSTSATRTRRSLPCS